MAPFGLANWTKLVLPVFPRNIPYRARPKSPPFNFFRHCETFFLGIFFSEFFSSKGPSCIFWCFATEWMLENPKGFLLSVFFGIVRFFPEKKISSIFSCFATEWMLKNLKGSPLSVFWHCETLLRQGLALAGPGAPLGSIFLVCNFFKKNFVKFSIFEYCKRILDTYKSFCYFWALDMAPTWAGRGLLCFNVTLTIMVNENGN